MFDELKTHASNERQVRGAGLESYVEHLMRMLQTPDHPDDAGKDEPAPPAGTPAGTP